MTKKRKIDEMITPLADPQQLVRSRRRVPRELGTPAMLSGSPHRGCGTFVAGANVDQQPQEDRYVTAPPEFLTQLSHLVSATARQAHRNPSQTGAPRKGAPTSLVRHLLAKKRQPYISTALPALAILMDKKISPGFVELASRKPNHHYGIRAAKSLEDAQARFVPNDFLPGSSYTQGMQGAYATGTAVSTEVVREAVDLMDKKCAEVARTDAQTSDRRFTTAVIAFVEGPGKGENFILIPYTGLGITGKSSIHSRFLYKFSDQQLISRFWRTWPSCQREGRRYQGAHAPLQRGRSPAHPQRAFLHAGNAMALSWVQHDIEALIGGAFVGGRRQTAD